MQISIVSKKIQALLENLIFFKGLVFLVARHKFDFKIKAGFEL